MRGIIKDKVFFYKTLFMAMVVWTFFVNMFVHRKPGALSWSNSISEYHYENRWEVRNGWMKIASEEVHVFSAYNDRRIGKNTFGMVQVMAVQPRSFNVSLYCFLVYKDRTICLKNAADMTTVFQDRRIQYYRTTMYSCYLPSFEVPQAVGLMTDKHCANKMNKQPLTKVVFEGWSPVKDFGVCVHSPLFNMSDHQLVAEHVEMNRIMGAKWFTFYIHSISALTRKLLKSYQEDGLVELVDNWSNGLPESVMHYMGQDLSIQDCLYRNMYKVKYLVYTDLDELIFPKKHPNWREMMDELERLWPRTGCFTFYHIAAFHDKTNLSVAKMRLLEHGRCHHGDVITALRTPRFFSFTQRSVISAIRRSKLIVKPLDMLRMRVHDADNNALYGGNRRKRVDLDIAVLYHYRKDGLERYRNGSVYFDEVQKWTPELFEQLKKRLCNLK